MILLLKPLSRNELRTLRALSIKSVRERRGAFLLEGVRAISSAMKYPEKIRLLAATRKVAGRSNVGTLLEHAAAAGIKIRSMTQNQLDGITETRTPSGLIGWIDWVPARRLSCEMLLVDLEKSRAGRLLFLDSVSDPGNVGSLLRAADAFGLDGVVMGKGTVEVTNPKVVRAAAGSILGLPYLAEGVALAEPLEFLQSGGWTIFRAEAHKGSPPPPEPPAEPWLLLLGGEAHGIDGELSNIGNAIHIQTPGSAESLNVAVAGGILLYSLCRKRGMDGRY